MPTPNSLYRSLFVNCSCADCVHAEYDEDRAEFYCRIDGRYREPDNNAPCSYFKEMNWRSERDTRRY